MKQYSPFYPPSTNDILHVHDMGKGREAVRREKQEDRRVEVVGGGRRAEVVGRERRVEKVGGERRVEKGVGRDRREGGGRGGGGGEGDMVRDFLPKPKLPVSLKTEGEGGRRHGGGSEGDDVRVR